MTDTKRRGRRTALGILAAAGVMLMAVPPAADADVVWNPVRFPDGGKTLTIPYAQGTRITGSIYICNDGASQRTFSIGEYVRTGPGPGNYTLWREEIKPLPIVSACPGTVNLSWDIPPGPSRVINLGYTAWGVGYFGAYDSILDLTVSHRLSLAAAERKVRNGDSVFFSGVMPAYFFSGPPTVLLQVRSGKKWRTFKAMQTLPDGSYFATYRFTNTNSRQTYKFRAKPFAASLYPFAVSASKKAKVTVRP
jgi:hypothetical protein